MKMENRRGALKRIIDEKGFVRIIEVHNGLSALVGETAQFKRDEEVLEYDGFWESSFTDSASKGLPDAEIVDYTSRLQSIDEILNVTTKPVVVDGDTGGSDAQFEYFIKHLERLSVSAVIIEDKEFPKRNSLDPEAKQTLEDPERFAAKIQRGKAVVATEDFMIIARIESFIAGVGLDDALQRATRYIRAGVDGIMVHSNREEPGEILEFAENYENLCEEVGRRPHLVSVPTTYNLVTDQILAEHGFNVVIHANHQLRAAHKAMMGVATTILANDRGFEAEPLCSPTPEVFSLVGFERIKEKDKEFSRAQRLPVIIPSAGRDPVFSECPKSLIRVGERPLLSYQMENIRKAGLRDIIIVRGHEGSQFDSEFKEAGLSFVNKDDNESDGSMHSLFSAREFMRSGFVLIYSDVLFDYEHLSRLIDSPADILLLVDNSYRFHKHKVDKRLDLVASKRGTRIDNYRSLNAGNLIEIDRIGKELDVDSADYEFVGLACFSEEGARILRMIHQDCQKLPDGPFHEAETFANAGLTDLFQEAIDRGFTIQGLQVYKGWIEIHHRKDVQIAEQELLNSSS